MGSKMAFWSLGLHRSRIAVASPQTTLSLNRGLDKTHVPGFLGGLPLVDDVPQRPKKKRVVAHKRAENARNSQTLL